ncbi:8-amino-7-oxononanoate synthase [Streptomyces sp. NPDC059169]|uniref:8-amino-7-oxononanoate synthase n=1 Tax=Streptomyces sp. NPDC059169 TaxID=3346754 RepID=UPI00369DCB68
MPNEPFDWIGEHADARRRVGLTRTIQPRPVHPALLDLASNDYLDLARHPGVTEAAAAAARRWGAGATGSRLVSGSLELHSELEAELADFCGFESALVFSSGYAANLAVVTALGDHGSMIVSDSANHASLIDGCRLSRARTAVVPHNNPEVVGKALEDHGGRAVVITESVFSVDGDAAPLQSLAATCRTRGAALIVDDAHGLGVLGDGGRGALNAAGLSGAKDVVASVTLSKSLGSQGGAVLGPAKVIQHLVNTARSFVFDTGLAPAAAGAALAGLRVLRREPERAAAVRTVAASMHGHLAAAGLNSRPPEAAVVSVLAPSPQAAARWAEDCRTAGLAVGCFRPPSVPDGISRLRLTARAALTEEQVAKAVDVVVRTAPAF